MNAYLCTYRHYVPTAAQIRKTAAGRATDQDLKDFLNEYENSFFDWGDDPSFFCSSRQLSDVNRASWGVCRTDVREVLREKDVVVFFCGRQYKAVRCWNYYFIGFGTVQHVVPRKDIWTNPKYKPYRSFYNVLAEWNGKSLVQKEYFHPFHDDWEKCRACAPYIIFDPTESAFNVTAPHPVATWQLDDKVPEIWNRDWRSKRIEKLLFIDRAISRRLRTSRFGYAHVKLNLTHEDRVLRPGCGMDELRAKLRNLV